MKPGTRSLVRAVAAAAMLCALAAGAAAGPSEDVRAAESAAIEGDVFTAINLLRKASDQNHPLAQARLAELLHGAGFDAEAVALYRKSAAQGEAAGEFGLGEMHAKGAGVPRDHAQAIEWYRKAERKNYPRALEALARAYSAGDLGLEKDRAKAAELEARRAKLIQAQAGK